MIFDLGFDRRPSSLRVSATWDFWLPSSELQHGRKWVDAYVAISNNAFQIRTSLRLLGGRYRIGGAGVISEEEPR